MRLSKCTELSFLNSMLHNPMIYKLKNGKYVSESIINRGIEIDISDVETGKTHSEYCKTQHLMTNDNDFVIVLIFKLLQNGIFIGAQNTVYMRQDDLPDPTFHHQSPCPQLPLHCDILAFCHKKRHVYPIVICHDRQNVLQAWSHAFKIKTEISYIKPKDSIVIPMVVCSNQFDFDGSLRLCWTPPKEKSRKINKNKKTQPRARSLSHIRKTG